MESRVARFHKDSDPGFSSRTPLMDSSLELRTAIYLIIFFGISVAVLLGMLRTDLIDRDSHYALMVAFTPGIIAVCSISSSLAFIIYLKHRLLLLSLSMLLFSYGAIAIDIELLECVAKVVFATSLGLWISIMLTSISQVLLIALLIIFVDIYSVFFGPTKRLVESGGRWIDYFTINLPVYGVDALSKLGVSDIIFFALFVGTTLLYRLRRAATALAMTVSIILSMVIGVSVDVGVPALPLLSISFLLANADLLYRRFLEEPDDNPNRGRG